MNDVNKLMTDAQQQLDEHISWLVDEIEKIPDTLVVGDMKFILSVQATQIKLRMARVDAVDSTSVLWEYPENLITFLQASTTPEHLRKTLDGAHFVDMTPGFSAKRVS